MKKYFEDFFLKIRFLKILCLNGDFDDIFHFTIFAIAVLKPNDFFKFCLNSYPREV